MAERGREGKSDIDRFLAEIERLRKKSQGVPVPPPVPVAKAKPVEAKAKAKPRLEMPPAANIPTVGAPRPDADVPIVRPITVATPIAPPMTSAPQPGSVRTEVPVASVKTVRNVVAAGQMSNRKMTPFAAQLSAFLAGGGGQALPMAIVIGEIFGPPKSMRS